MHLYFLVGDSKNFADEVAKVTPRYIDRFMERIGDSPNALLVNPEDMPKLPGSVLKVGDLNLMVMPTRGIQRNYAGLERITQ